MKKQSNLGRLLSYAGSRKILSYLSWFFAAVSALIALVPFWYIWRILKEVIEVAPNFGEAVNITHYGWMAVLFAVAAVLVYITGLMCSHMAAFRIATNMRIEMTEHISKLPLGVIEQFGSGKLRRTISETTGATEAYLAHQLPDFACRVRLASRTFEPCAGAACVYLHERHDGQKHAAQDDRVSECAGGYVKRGS